MSPLSISKGRTQSYAHTQVTCRHISAVVPQERQLLYYTIILHVVVRKPADLQDLAPGTNPPFVTFNGEVKVDVNKIEEFLEEKLTPPRYTNTHKSL